MNPSPSTKAAKKCSKNISRYSGLGTVMKSFSGSSFWKHSSWYAERTGYLKTISGGNLESWQ